MSNTTIKFKRTDFAASIDAIVLQRGEPAVDFDRQILWIGDGDVNLQFAAVDSSSAMHSITSAGESGDVHTVSITKYGSVLKGTASTKASFQRLGFYDLGDIAALPSTNASFPSQDVSDTTGILSRWHWIEKTHAGPRRSLFVTNDSISGIGTGSNGSGMGNMRHAGGTSAADLTGYRVEALSYEYAGDMTSTNPAGGGGSHVLVVDYTSSITNNVLKFRRLIASDISNGAPEHDMTSSSHTCSASKIFYSRGVDDMTSLAFDATSVIGKVIKRASSTALEWSTVDWSEITGNFNPDLGSTALDNNTMRFDATLGSWVINKYVNSINNSTTKWSGHEIINLGVIDRTIGTTYKAYNSSNAVISTVEMYLPGSAKKVSPYYIGSTDGGFVFDIKGNHDQFLFYAGNDPDVGDVPNFWIRKTGGVRIQATTSHTNLLALTDINGLAKAADLEIGGKTGTREIIYDTASRAVLPEYSGILISATTIRQNHTGATASAEVSGLRIDDFKYMEGVASNNRFQPVHMLRLGTIDSVGSAFGARFGDITVYHAATDPVSGRTAAGIYFNHVKNNRLESGNSAFGLRFGDIESAFGTASGISIANVDAEIDAYGLNFTTAISGKKNVYGININALTNITGVTPSTTASNTVGLKISGLRDGVNVAGISITDITSSDGAAKMVGLYVNLNSSSYSLHETAVPTGSANKHAIYATGGKSYFGGNTTVAGTFTVSSTATVGSITAMGVGIVGTTFSAGSAGNEDDNYLSTFHGDVKLKRYGSQGVGRRLLIDGNGTDETSGSGQLTSSVIAVERGHIDVTSGDLRLYGGIVRDNTFDGTITSQSATTDEYLKSGLTVIDTSKYRTLILTTATTGTSPNIGDTPHTVRRIKPGYNGQRLTIVARIAATSQVKRYIELKGVNITRTPESSFFIDYDSASVQSNIVIEKSDFYNDAGTEDQEIHVYHDQPVELVFVENYFNEPPNWTDTYVGDYTVPQRRGAWILLH